MRLQLQRPLVCFDLETTGLDVLKDRVVEISCVKVHPDGRREVRTRRLNPGQPIAAEATLVHGIHDADVATEPRFDKVAKSLFAFISGADLSGYNLERFDLPILAKEFERAGITFPEPGIRVVDSHRIYALKEPRNLAAAFRYYCHKELEGAHGAEADAVAAADILLAQIELYADLPAGIDALADYCRPPDWVDSAGKIRWRNHEAVLMFGRHSGKSLRELCTDEPDYLAWILAKDFSAELKDIVRAALDGRFPVPPPKVAAPGAPEIAG